MIEVLKRLGYYPRFCVWELTLACDMRCQHCGSFAGRARADELTQTEALVVVDQLAQMGCERLTLSGGEPTLHPGWDLIGRELAKRGVRVNIITNGWSWTADHTQRAIDAGLENVAFSIDGFEADHDRVRAKQGSFRRSVAGLDHCVARGLPASVVTHINQLNKHSLPEFHRMLHERGVSSWQLQIGNPAGVMGNHQDLVLPAEDLLWIVPLVAELRCRGPGRPVVFASDNVGYYGRYERELRDRGATICFWIGCRAGCQVVGIESNGNVKGCLSLPSEQHHSSEFVEGNLRHQTLSEIWSRPDAFSFNRNYDVSKLEGFCATCRLRDICRGGCSWSAYTRSGSRYNNPLCFYRAAVEHQRWDLIPDGEIDRDRQAGCSAGANLKTAADSGDSIPLG
jgi:radical SAM protein with 4Fe4S-binding SPASM domain